MRKGNGGIIGPLNNPTILYANGIWSMDEQQQFISGHTWPGSPAATVPNAPVITSATSPAAGQATVNFTAGYDGGTTVTSITVTAYPGAIQVVVSGPFAQGATGTANFNTLSAGATYSFQIFATNSVGNSKTNTSGNVTILSYYSLLMSFTGADGGTTFTDTTGISTFSITAGSPTTSTTTYQFSPSSFKGTQVGAATQISTSDKSNFAPGTGAFTVECWVYSTSQGGFQSWFSTRTATGYAQAMFFGLSGGNVILYGAAPFITSSMTLPTNTWTHVAISKPASSPSIVYMYVGGAYAGQFNEAVSGTLNFTEQGCSIGGSTFGGPGAYPFNGYIDELRMLKGYGAYSGTGPITVPTAPFPYPAL